MNQVLENNSPEEPKTLEINDKEVTHSLEEDLSFYSPRELAIHQLLITVIQLEKVIDEETISLESQKMPDFNEINNRKIRLLRDVEKRQENLLQFQKEAYNEEIIAKLEAIKPKLIRNQYLLKLHLEAVGELVTLLKEKAAALEEDGTYKVDDCLTQDIIEQNN